MKIESIEQLAYDIKKVKKKGKGVTVFLGAGVSKTAGIPTAGEIINDILTDSNYNADPKIKSLTEEERTSYTKIMSCLMPDDRKELFTKYVNNSKINVTHIYLAHMIKEGYVDYVLTPNFDDLMLRALALFNIFPPVYDLAMLDNLDTTTLDKQTVVYLHGRHNGIWQLNTPEEMEKVDRMCPRLFNKIQDHLWLVMGYSGSDKVFQHICELGRFNQKLYWLGWHDKNPNDNVCDNLLKQKNKDTYLIRGYDSDSFMIKLHNQLDIKEHPQVFGKPFSHLQELLDGIVDIEDKQEFASLKERFNISQKQVKDAINRYDKKPTTKKQSKEKLHKDILNLIANEDFDENKIKEIEEQVLNSGDKKSKELLGDLYFSMAYQIKEEDEKSLLKATELYERSIELNSNSADAQYNGGVVLSLLAEKTNGVSLYEDAIIKYKKSIELNPNNADAYHNLGLALLELAKLLGNDIYLHEAVDILKKGEKLGADIYNLACVYALLKNKGEALSYLKRSFHRLEQTTDFVRKEEDWKEYLDDADFIALLDKFKDN